MLRFFKETQTQSILFEFAALTNQTKTLVLPPPLTLNALAD